MGTVYRHNVLIVLIFEVNYFIVTMFWLVQSLKRTTLSLQCFDWFKL